MSWNDIATQFAKMSPNEWTSVITGVTGFVFELASFWQAAKADARSARAEAKSDETAKQARELNYVQEKQAVLVLLYQEESANEMFLRRLHEAIERAKRVEATEAVTRGTDRLEDGRQHQRFVASLSGDVDRLPSNSASHEDLIALREVVNKLKQLVADQENQKHIGNGLIAAIEEAVEVEKWALRIVDRARNKVLNTGFTKLMPVVLHEFRESLLVTKWAQREAIQPFFQKRLTRIPVELGLEGLGEFAPEEVATLKQELCALTLE